MVCFGTFISSLDSAIFAPGIAGAAREFGISTETGNLGTALYVLTFAFGPFVWAPGAGL